MKTEIQKMRDRIKYLEAENRSLKIRLSHTYWETRAQVEDTQRIKDFIIEAVCKHFETDLETLAGYNRHRDLIAGRFILAYLLYKDAFLTLTEVGKMLGGRDHTTILHAVQQVKSRISGDYGYREYHDYLTIKIKLDEFIEQVETAY